MKFLLAVLPSAGVLFLFCVAIRAIVQADRRERSAYAKTLASREAAPETGPGGQAPPNG